jgi:hypothetical protein
VSPFWIFVLVLMVVFFAWTGWVLRKRSPNRPGEDTPRRDLGGMEAGVHRQRAYVFRVAHVPDPERTGYVTTRSEPVSRWTPRKASLIAC